MDETKAAKGRKNPVTLVHVPVELLSQIAASLDVASLKALSRSCKPLHHFVQHHGWRAYVLTNYPHHTGRGHWQNAAHSLIRQAEAWKSLALNGQFILPTQKASIVCRSYKGSGDFHNDQQEQMVHQSEEGQHQNQNCQTEDRSTNAVHNPAPSRNRRPVRGQTMGYQPALDVVERDGSKKSSDRQEILVVGAGAEVLLRRRDLSLNKDLDLSGLTLGHDVKTVSRPPKGSRWTSIKNPLHRDGLDDVTALKVLNRESELKVEESVELIVGRANGLIESLSISTELDSVKSVTAESFVTDGLPVRLLDIAPADSIAPRQFAVGLGKRDVCLFDTSSQTAKSRISVECGTGQTVRNWALHHLNSALLAVGHGVSKTPLDVFSIRTEEGIATTPLRRFRLPKANAVYSIASLPEFASGTVFVTGTYDGSVMVHDMRDRRDVVDVYTDPYEAGAPVYGVLSAQPHIVLAATALHQKMLVFDLRRGANYSALLLNSNSTHIKDTEADESQHRSCRLIGSNSTTMTDSGISSTMYLSQPQPLRVPQGNSIYSLARASSSSPTIYVGLEAGVVQMDAFRSDDRLPDPVFASAPAAIAKAWTASKRAPKGGNSGGNNGTHPTTRQDRYRTLLKSRLTWNSNAVDLRLMPHAGPASSADLTPWAQLLMGERPPERVAKDKGSQRLLDPRWIARSERSSDGW